MDLDIRENAALITASSSGLGKASAKALAREGVDIVINGRDKDRLEDAAGEVEAVATGAVVTQSGDLADPDNVEALVERTVSEFGRLDYLVTSAGGPPRMEPLEATEEDWYDTFDLLVMSVVRLVKHAEPHLAADGGETITNITSRSVKRANSGNVLSSSTRMAVIGFEKTLSKELAPGNPRELGASGLTRDASSDRAAATIGRRRNSGRPRGQNRVDSGRSAW